MIQHPEITVLYVDDEKDNLFVFKANFNRKFEVITTLSPEEALNELDLHHDEIIVVISDMRMPDMNGVEFIKKAKAKYKNIFYYILTGYGHNQEIEAAIEDKLIENYFTKPFDALEIEKAILDVTSSLRRN
ncbi:MAG: response regulator [Flammeovirgaceae bacterium]|nr:response regulator [Flammeovirgaceae bacterium]MBR10414.1 response regulator [Rickettsiales bacterium]HCX22875.1 response regulator [Cytophagales bacterium]|tara:strand:+ start:202 stop:594 length:393 start_codon:yes stop_codon:yes gene_type:complete